MEVDNILVTIQLAYNQFTRTERKIADYVLKNSAEVPFMSITELADACGVAEASVHRFCRSIKVKGYQEFRMRLSICTTRNEAASDAEAGGNGNTDDDAFRKILEYHLNAIRETNALLDREVVDRTVQMMTDAKRVIFLGVGNSMTTAEEAEGRFLHITPKVEYVSDPHMQCMMASMLDPDDMLIFISYSGDTTDNVRVAELARRRGARITVITRFPKSALTKYADTVLICGSRESPLEGGSMGAKMSQLHIIDVLFQCYYQKNLEVSRENNTRTAEANMDKFEDKS